MESKHPPWPSGPAERQTVKHMEAVLAVTYPLLRLADFRGAGRCPLAKTGALRQPRLRCFVHWTRSARLQRFQRNHDSTVPPEKHDFNEINEINEITIPRPPTESRKQRNPRKQRNASFAGISFFSWEMDKSLVSLRTLKLPSQSRRPAGVSPAPTQGEPSVPPSNPANEW